MALSFSAAELLHAQRRIDYAHGTAALDEDHDAPGAAAVYEQALCNGLAVIVAARWPGSDLNRKGQVKSAKELLEVIAAEEARAGRVGPELVLDEPATGPRVSGVHIPLWDDEPETESGVHVEVAVCYAMRSWPRRLVATRS